ncbi:MAG: DASS family sodium-coupled anion symporter, partial [Deltaproteobacteria bacterium]|nr:DASS family sodium-coupled anion symporter [Deltaproteobacteria bacterium]
LAGCVAAALLGVAPMKEVFAPFSDPVIFLFIGSFMIAESMRIHGLDRRFASIIFSVPFFSKSVWRIIFSAGLACMLLSMWINNTAAAAMMIPVVMSALSAVEVKSRKGAFSAAALAVAYSASIGGIATPVGTAPNLITLGILSRTQGIQISFFEWMVIGVPLSLLLFGALFLILRFRSGLKHHAMPAGEIRVETASPNMTRGEKNTLFAFLLVVILWTLPGFLGIFSGHGSGIYSAYTSRVHEAVAALAGAVLLFFLPVNFREKKFTITWEQAERIDWGTIILFGSGLSLGALMFATGLGDYLGNAILGFAGKIGLLELTAIAIVCGVIITEITSNTAATNVIVPVVISLANTLDFSPVPPALGACFGASMAFMLPIATPPNAIAYATGHVRITRMISTGVYMNIAAAVMIFTLIYFRFIV